MAESPGTVVLGIDPGSNCTGWGVVREASGCAELLGTGVIRPGKGRALAERLGRLYQGLSKVIAEYGPVEAAMEDVFVSKNTASALKLGQARGALMAACATAGLTVEPYAPTKVKQALVGTGRAEKTQVAFMVAQVLGVRKPDWPVDASDALAVAVCHLNHRRLARLARS